MQLLPCECKFFPRIRMSFVGWPPLLRWSPGFFSIIALPSHCKTGRNPTGKCNTFTKRCHFIQVVARTSMSYLSNTLQVDEALLRFQLFHRLRTEVSFCVNNLSSPSPTTTLFGSVSFTIKIEGVPGLRILDGRSVN